MTSNSTWILIAAVVTACCIGYALFDSDDADAAVSFSDGTLNYESISESEAKVTGFANGAGGISTCIPDGALTNFMSESADVCIITFGADENGMVNYDLPITVPRGTEYTVNGSNIDFRVDDTIYCASAYPVKKPHYVVSFDKWTVGGEELVSGTFDADMAIRAEFTCVEERTVVFESLHGTFDKDSITVPSGTEFTVSGTSIQFGEETVTVTADEGHFFAKWLIGIVEAPASGTVTRDMIFFADCDAGCTMTFVAGDNGSVSMDSVVVPRGTAFTVDGNTITTGYGEFRYVVAAICDEIEHYTVTFECWTRNGFVLDSGTVSEDITVEALFLSKIDTFKVTIGSSDFYLGSVNGYSRIEISAEYGASVSVDGDKLTIGDKVFTAMVKESGTGSIVNRFVGFTGTEGVTSITDKAAFVAVFEADVVSVPVVDRVAVLDVPCDTATFDDSAVAKIKSDADSFTVNTAIVSVSFDRGAISRISPATFDVGLLHESQYPEQVKDALVVVDIDFGTNHDFTGGKLTIIIPVEVEGKVKIGHVDGSVVEEIPATYDAENKQVSFEVDHLSTFAVLNAADEPSGSDDGSVILVVAAVAVLAIIAVAGVFLVKSGRISKKN